MSLLQQFIDFRDWPASRKTALLMAAGLPAQIILSLIAGYYARESGITSTGGIELVLYGGVGAVLICLFFSLVAVRLQQEGRWTAHTVIHVYGGWLFWMYAALGIWSSPLVAASPLLILLLAFWYDERIGWVGVGHFVVGLAVLMTLVYSGTVPYAYAIQERSLDVHANPAWPIALMPAFMGFFFFAFFLSLLTLAARRRQDARLAQAQVLIRRYLPTHLADRIEAGEHHAEARPTRQKLTIFFSDIVGFTKASDELDPEELSDILDEYLSEMAEIAESYGASINQMAGDGIMLLFGAPVYTSDKDHALRSVRMGLAMQQRLRELKSSWLRYGLRAPIEARVGINTGYVSVGDFGSAGRKVYTAIGMQANLAARIQVQCEPGKILLSESTWALVKDEVVCDAEGQILFKGVHYPVPIFQVRDIGTEPATRAKVTQIAARA